MVTLELADLLPGVELPTLSRLGRGSSERGRGGWGWLKQRFCRGNRGFAENPSKIE